MDLPALIAAHADSVFLDLGGFAEEVLLHPAEPGEDPPDCVPLTALVTFPAPSVPGGPDRRAQQSGTVHLPASVGVLLRDTFTIRGQLYGVVSIAPADGGLQEIAILRVTREVRTGRGAL